LCFEWCWQSATGTVEDELIAQSCVDRGISFLTRDGDFRAFVAAGALDLVVQVIFLAPVLFQRGRRAA
jgi:hypothetical protein